KIVIGLRTVDGGGVVTVLEPGDYAIGTEQGKITFPLSVATIETKFKTNILNIKFNGQLPAIENRQYLDMIPGFSNRHHNYYFTPQGSFNFPENRETITMTGKVTMDTSTELTFYVDANGKVSGGLNGKVEIALP